jgi:hypothetical protein
MLRLLTLLACIIPSLTLAQSQPDQPRTDPAQQMMMMHMHHMPGPDTLNPMPAQAGQDAFAAIREIIGILEADPSTDWSKVNIDALRAHLVDMNHVILAADVKSEEIEGGMRFTVTGAGPVKESVQRMVIAHAGAMNRADGWGLAASEIADGAVLTVRPPPAEAARLPGLGFFGLMTRGMHHQMHHLMIARGQNLHP